MKRVEKDPAGGWIARRRDGSIIYDKDWRWNSRSVARDVVRQYDDPTPGRAVTGGAG